MKTYDKRLLVVSNRLPIVIKKNDAGDWYVGPGHGGLVTALAPVMKKNEGLWIGWPGNEEELDIAGLLHEFSQGSTFALEPVILSPEEVEKYYRGFSNETLWPLFHDLLGHSKFESDNWKVYQEVNRRFAEKVASSIEQNDFVWIHDYQLILVGRYLRILGVRRPLTFFLHIPFPSLDLFRRLPWKHEIIHALMDYDLLGFQTIRDRRNFVQCIKGLIPEVEVDIRRRHSFLRYGKRTVKVGNYPIGIDFNEFNDDSKSEEVAEAAWYLHEHLAKRQLVLGIDRLDYTKGIPERFMAFERALEKYPDLHGNISFLQVVVPSRTYVPDYQNLREVLDRLVGHINGKYGQSEWVPIHYMFRSLDRYQLLGHYKASEIALITPLRDGMNLIAKEYCACSVDLNGVLILSEFAGAADQLAKGAILVNPYDLEGTADAIYKAFMMDTGERKRRMQILRAEVRRNNVHRWVKWFMDSMSGEDSTWLGNRYGKEGNAKEVIDSQLWLSQTETGEQGGNSISKS
jgi:trehalose 6-phosphate synthase/phosphatase